MHTSRKSMNTKSKHERVLYALKRTGKPVTASHIARAARLPVADVIIVLNELVASGIAERFMPAWGQVVYKLNEDERDTTV